MSDAERAWLEAAGRGDRDAFDAFVCATTPAVWGLVRRLTLDPAVAEDVLQETFLGAWRAARTYTGEGTARAWLYGLARRHAARSWRRRAGEPAEAEPLDQLGELAGWGQDPEVAAARAEDRRALLAALATLPEADQEVIAHCDLEGLGPAEAAALLGAPPGTVRVRLHRARLRLMAALRDGGRHG